MKTVKGNLIRLALKGHFDIIAHGCNCFCAQKSGIASAMVSTFGTNDPDKYSLEHISRRGDEQKLGMIQSHTFALPHALNFIDTIIPITDRKELSVVNCYTQYSAGTDKLYLDYDALGLCLDRINKNFDGKVVGLPKIGCGLAGGDWRIVSEMIEDILTDVDVTIVEL